MLRNQDIDEFSLEYVKALFIRERALLVLSVMVGLLSYGLYIYISKPVYESRAVISIGQFGPKEKDRFPNFLEDPLVLVSRINEKYKVVESSYPCLTTIETDKKTNGIIIMKSRAYSPDEATNFLEKVVFDVKQNHDGMFDEIRKIKKEHEFSIKREIEKIDFANQIYDKKMQELEENDVLGILLVSERSHQDARKLDLERELREIHINNSEPYAKPTIVLSEPSRSNVAVNRSIIHFLAAGFFGLMLGLIVAVTKKGK